MTRPLTIYNQSLVNTKFGPHQGLTFESPGSTTWDAKKFPSESCESLYPSATLLKLITSQLPSPPRIVLPLIPSTLTLIDESARALEPPMYRFKTPDIKAVTPSTVRDGDSQNMRPGIEAFVHCECDCSACLTGGKFNSQKTSTPATKITNLRRYLADIFLIIFRILCYRARKEV